MRAQAPQNAAVGTGDAELVRRARGRDEAAVRSIMQSNNRRLYRIARGILRNESEAEDVVQETYVRAFTQLDDFRGDSSLATPRLRHGDRFIDAMDHLIGDDRAFIDDKIRVRCCAT